jgi:hypothetical protein
MLPHLWLRVKWWIAAAWQRAAPDRGRRPLTPGGGGGGAGAPPPPPPLLEIVTTTQLVKKSPVNLGRKILLSLYVKKVSVVVSIAATRLIRT